MSSGYVKDTSKWLDWQRDYRFGVILIIPPHEVSAVIDPVRAQFDPRSAAVFSAHVSVSDPLQCELSPGLQREIRCVLGRIEPFVLHYGEPRAPLDRPGTSCPVFPQESIDLLKQALHSTAAFSREAYKRRNISAHLTIAEFLPAEDRVRSCAVIKSKIKPGSFRCDRLEYVVPDSNFHFNDRSTFFLGHTAT